MHIDTVNFFTLPYSEAILLDFFVLSVISNNV